MPSVPVCRSDDSEADAAFMKVNNEKAGMSRI